jgi:hypothetical protein
MAGSFNPEIVIVKAWPAASEVIVTPTGPGVHTNVRDIGVLASCGSTLDKTVLTFPLIWLIRTLRGLTPIFGCFNGERFDELQVERHLSSNPMLALPECWYWIRKLQARFFAGDYVSAVEASVVSCGASASPMPASIAIGA